jgi:hypothetical protein
MSSTSALPGGPNLSSQQQPPATGGGGMDELLPLVLQLTNPEQVREKWR